MAKIFNFLYPVDFTVSKAGRCNGDVCWTDPDNILKYIEEFAYVDLVWHYYSNGIGSLTFATKDGSHMDIATNAVCLRFVQQLYFQKHKQVA
jgi:hypothetical protein